MHNPRHFMSYHLIDRYRTNQNQSWDILTSIFAPQIFYAISYNCRRRIITNSQRNKNDISVLDDCLECLLVFNVPLNDMQLGIFQ